MKKTALGFAAALVLALALALSFWLVQSNGESSSAGPATAASPAPAPEHAPEELSTPAASEPAPEKDESARAAEIALPASNALDARRDAENPLAVEGALVVPAGMPADETLAVEVYLSDPAELLLLAPVPEEKVHGRARVGLDGRFEARLPAGTERFWTIARGRYLIAAADEARVPLGKPLALEPELGGWITGRLVPPAQAAIEEGDTWSAELRPDPMAAIGAANPMWGGGGDVMPERSAAVDASEHTFEIRGVHAAEGYTLSVAPKSLAATKTGAFDVTAGEHVALELPLGLGGSIQGRVVDGAGQTVEGAEIEAVQDPIMFGQGGFEVRKGESGADGAFELLHVRPGKLALRIEAEGYLDQNESLELAEGQRVTGYEIVLDSGARVAGRVTWPEGTPAAEIEVEVDFDPSFLGGMEAFNAMRGADGEGKTDADGRFAVDGLGKGPFLVTAEAERETGGEESEWHARASAVKPGTLDLALVLEPPIGVAGRVVDDLGAPVAKFSVHARTKTSGMIAGLGAETASDTFEDPDGRFLLEGLRAGDWEAFASQAGYGMAQPVPFEMPLAEGAELALVLERAASVQGSVLTPSGAPIAGATVGRKLGLGDLSRLGAETGRPAAATTDEEGRFALEGLSPEPQELVARHPDYASSAPLAVELAPAETHADLVLTLRTGGRILGVIYDDEGHPWPGQMILTQDPTLEQGQRWSTSDGSGAFEVANLAPGTYQVMTMPRAGGLGADDDDEEVEGGDFASMFADMKFTMAEVKEGEDTFVELGAKPANPVRVHGRVTAAGEGVSGAMVSFIADGGGEGFESLKFTSTASEGAFEVELAKPGRYLVTVQQMIGTGQQQSFELLCEVPEVEEHELSVEMPLGGIAGVVRGPDGAPVANARVSLGADGPIANGSFTGGNYAEIWTGADGRYELRWLKPGAYSVSAGGAFLGGLFGDTGEVTFGRQVRRGVEVGEGEWVRGVDFRLETPGRIAGRVSDTSGAAVADAAIFLRDGEGNPIDRISMVTTDSSGRFEYASLEPGPYQIQARTTALVSGSATSVQVREGEATEAALVLDGGTVLVVSLSDKEGNYVRCKVSVTDGEGHQVNGLWSLNDLMQAFSGGGFSTDEQRVGPLPAGKYKIEATADDGRDAQKIVTLSGQEERPIRLRLD